MEGLDNCIYVRVMAYQMGGGLSNDYCTIGGTLMPYCMKA